MYSPHKVFACTLLVFLQGCGGGSGAGTATPSGSVSIPIPVVAPPVAPATPQETQQPLPLSAEAAAFSCPAVVAMPRAMAIETQYAGASIDATFSTVDPAKAAAQEAERAKFDRPVTAINTLSDRYFDTSDESLRQVLATCLAGHFAALPASGAMTGADSDTDKYYREWMVSSLAVSWLRAEAGLRKVASVNAVRDWFDQMASEIRTYHDRRQGERGGRDNHDYWGAAAVAAAARITERESDLAWSRQLLTAGLGQVDSQGMLAAELARGKKATHYHLFSAVPLAAVAILTGTDIETVAGNAFGRLAGRLASDLADAKGGLIAARTGYAQDEVNRGQLVLLASQLRSNGDLATRLRSLAGKEPVVSYFLGGDLTFLMENGKP